MSLRVSTPSYNTQTTDIKSYHTQAHGIRTKYRLLCPISNEAELDMGRRNVITNLSSSKLVAQKMNDAPLLNYLSFL